MAFGKKYYSSYKSNNDIDYYLEIWLKDYDSTASEITIGAGGPVITYETEEDDRFSPILSSNCRLPLMVTNTLLQTFVSQLRTTYQEKQVYLHLYKATSSTYTTTKPIWSGFLTMDLGSGEDVSFPYEQELIFVDGLSLLKEIDFVDFSDPDYETRTAGNYAPENMYWGPARYTYWIKEILLKSGAAISGANGQGVTQDYGFTTAVNWYNGTMTSTSQSSDPLYLTECKASMFHTKDENETFLPDNCYDVLKELLRHWGARITYWKHEFWIVQIPEYIVDESGFIDNPDNINSRQYNKSGTYLGSQDHLGDTYSSRYEQTIQSDQISKLVGTKYNYLPAIHRVNAKFLSLNGENHFGGFPFGANPYGIDFFQSRIANPSSADFLWVSIPLNWKWDMSGTALPNGHTNGWWARIRFNLYCTQNNGGTITTYYLQYKSSDDSYYWVDSSNWTPLGNESPAYIISSRNLVETDYIGFQEQIEFVDSSGSNISLTGDWDFYMSIENYGTSSNNPGSFYCRFSGYNTGYVKRNPSGTAPSLPAPGGGGASTGSGTVSWSNSLQDNSISFNSPTASQTNFPSGYNTGASQVDKAFTWKSPLKGFLQVLSNTVNATYGITNDTIVSNSSNTEVYGFGDLLWGDSIVQTARGNLNVWNGNAFTKTNVNGKWGRGILTGEKTFTQMLIDEFLTGQIQVVISPSMRLVVGEQNKNQTATASGGGTATRPRYVNPIGRLRETRSNETDPEYFFRRGSFHTLYDEWDYEGYQILRDTITVTTNTNDIGGLGGSQDDNPIDAAKVKSNVETALMMNSPVAYVRTTVPATGSNVIVNGNFNVATGWTLGTGWTIDTTTKKAKFAATGSTSDLVQSVLTAELTYQINFTIEVTAGSLIVKAGSSGTSQTITTSGDYSIYLDCEGSTDIKFTAGTTFNGTITYITAKDQKSISSIPINVIGSTVFKTNDTLDLVNSRDGEIMTLNVSSNQGASDDTISVTSTPLYEDIAANSVLLINQDDLSAQYQNKTKGTVGGFDITATSIDSGSVAISSYIDDDSFATASATSLATSESIKAYVDTQVGSADTLQEVTDNGNTTTNSIMIGSSSSPSTKLHVVSPDETVATIERNSGSGYTVLNIKNGVNTSGNSVIRFSDSTASKGAIDYEHADDSMRFNTNASERMRLTSDGKLGIAVSSPHTLLNLNDNNVAGEAQFGIGDVSSYYLAMGHNSAGNTDGFIGTVYNNDAARFDIRMKGTAQSDSKVTVLGSGNVGIGTTSPSYPLHVTGNIKTTDKLLVEDSSNSRLELASSISNQARISAHKTNLNQTLPLLIQAEGIKFGTVGGGEKMRLDSSGKLLLNTTSSITNELFQVDGSGYFSSHIYVQGGVRLPDSVGSSPALTFNNDTTIGLSRYTTNTILITGDLRAGNVLLTGSLTGTTATFSGQVTIPATPVASTDAASKGYVDAQVGSADTLQEVTDNGPNTTNAVVIGSSSNASANNNYGTPTFSVEKDSFVASQIMAHHNTSGNYGMLGIGKSRGTQASPSIVASGEKLAGLFFYGYDGAAYKTAAGIEVIVDGTPGTNDMPGALTFGTTPDGSGGFTERMRLTSDGKLGLGVTNPDVQFHASGDIKFTNAYVLDSIKHSGDSDTQIAFDTDTIKFDTNSSERMRLTSDGRLGIGTTNPSETLGVAGNIRLENGTQRNIIGPTNENLGIFANPNHADEGILFSTDNGTTTEMILLNGGNFGINTSSPSEKLHVVGDALITGDSHADAFKPAVSGNPIKFKNFDSSTEFARITDGGNVLIGTTTDTGFKLNVSGSITTAGGSANITAPRHMVADSNAIIYRNNDNLTLLTYQSKNITFMPNNSESVRFLANGNVLIGTTTDDGSSKLQVNGNVRLSNSSKLFLWADHDLNFLQYYRWESYTSLLMHISNAGTGGVGFFTNGSERARITSGGNLLIGTTTDSGDKLQVNGNVKLNDNFLYIGTGNDFYIRHDGSNTTMFNSTGHFGIYNAADGKDITFYCDDGSGGLDTYLNLDGGTTSINLFKTVLIGTTTNTGAYKIDVAGKQRVQDTLELDDVLMLNAISTPSDPAAGKSVIYMDSSDGGIKCKINVGGTVVTRTIASFE